MDTDDKLPLFCLVLTGAVAARLWPFKGTAPLNEAREEIDRFADGGDVTEVAAVSSVPTLTVVASESLAVLTETLGGDPLLCVTVKADVGVDTVGEVARIGSRTSTVLEGMTNAESSKRAEKSMLMAGESGRR